MLNILVYLYCTLAVEITPKKYLTFGDCQHTTFVCIDKHNQQKYEESMWLDVPDDKMSVESFKECIYSRIGK